MPAYDEQGYYLDDDGTVYDPQGRVVGQLDLQQMAAANPEAAGMIQSIADPAVNAYISAEVIKSLLGPEAASTLPTIGVGPVASGAQYGAMLGSAPSSSVATPNLISASRVPVAEPTTITNFAGDMTPALGAAGAGLGAYGMYNAVKGGANRQSSLMGGLSGAGAGLGLAMMGLGPVGWLAGGGALLGAGLPQIKGLKNVFGGGESTHDYRNRKAQELIEMGYRPDEVAGNFDNPKSDASMWSRVKDVALNNPLTIWGSTGIKKALGPEQWRNIGEFGRFAAAQYAIDNGLVSEGKGVINIEDPEKLLAGYQNYINNQAVRERYDAWKKWAAENVPLGANAGTYFGYTDIDKQREAEGGYKYDLSKLAPNWVPPGVELPIISKSPAEVSQAQSNMLVNAFGLGNNTGTVIPGIRPNVLTAEVDPVVQRSRTRSPGIDMNGNRINYY